MISRYDLSLANAIAHGEQIGYAISFHCETCKGKHFEILHYESKIENRLEDIIIQRTYYLKCINCGAEEADKVLTIVPSWINHPSRESGEVSE